MNDIILFECPNHPGHLRLTRQACADSWRKAKSGCSSVCQGCNIGAENAGEPAESNRQITTIDRVCARCLRTTNRYVYGRICVSCANRGYEFVKGKNARGTKPKFIPKLFSTTLCYVLGGFVRYRDYKFVASALEAEIDIIKHSTEQVIFGRCSQPIPMSRRYLALGLPVNGSKTEKRAGHRAGLSENQLSLI